MISLKKLKKIFFLLKLIIGYIIYFISGFITRNSKIWVFGSFGIFNDNSKYLYVYLTNHPQHQIRPIWISSNKQSIYEAKKYGEAYYKFSLLGIFYCLIAKVYIFSCYISEINYFTSKNCLTVNLWHGIPLKKIEFDITTPPLVKLFKNSGTKERLFFPWLYKKYDLVLSPSEFVANYSFKTAFRIKDENLIIAQYPRVSFLEEINISFSQKNKSYKKIFLYAPTWRDTHQDFIQESNLDFDKLDKLMRENNSLFLMKFHAATQINIDLKKYKNIKLVSNKIDPIYLLNEADCLITDYSSIYFDYLTLNRPILYFCFDIKAYIENRELYFQYKEVVAGKMVSNFTELLTSMKKIIEGQDSFMNRRQLIKSKFTTTQESKRNDYIVSSIKKKIDEI